MRRTTLRENKKETFLFVVNIFSMLVILNGLECFYSPAALRRASLIRLCQPDPSALNAAMMSGSKRIAPDVSKDGTTQYRFTDSCGQAYELGYRLEGKTLHFPRGGAHTLPEGTEAEAEKVLRETYGLVGDPDALIRTKGL